MRSKWIDIASPGLPAAEVAAEVLRLRAQVVDALLPLAAHQADRDVEYVHQLRVGCRRASAALAAFRPLMNGRTKRLRGWLKQIRRAAGPARDVDVLLERIDKEENHRAGHDYLVARLQHRRERAQAALIAIEATAQDSELSKSVERCVTALRDHDEITIHDFARLAMRSAGKSMCQLADVSGANIDHLHELRIASKRLRYSIEVFHGVFPDELKNEVYPVVEKIQSRLGKINDHATAQTLFHDWLIEMSSGELAAQLAGRVAEEHAAAHRAQTGFLGWWTAQRAAAFEAQLAELIGEGR